MKTNESTGVKVTGATLNIFCDVVVGFLAAAATGGLAALGWIVFTILIIGTVAQAVK